MSTDCFYPETELTGRIIGTFYRVYNQLGFGFLETVYRRALGRELTSEGINVESEIAIDVWYNDIIAGQFRADLLVERKVIIEIKASQALVEADWKQLLNYLHATHIEVGLLLHFGPKAFFRAIHLHEFTQSPITLPRMPSSAGIVVCFRVHPWCRFSSGFEDRRPSSQSAYSIVTDLTL